MLTPVLVHHEKGQEEFAVSSSAETLKGSSTSLSKLPIPKGKALILFENAKEGIAMVEKARYVVDSDEELVLCCVEKHHGYVSLFGAKGPDHDISQRMESYFHDQAVHDLMLIVRTANLTKLQVAFTCAEAEVQDVIDEFQPRFICRPNRSAGTLVNGSKDKFPILYL